MFARPLRVLPWEADVVHEQSMRIKRSPVADPGAVSALRSEPSGAAAPHQDRFRRMVEQIPAIVYIETDDWPAPATYMSPRIEQVLGLPPEAFGNRDIWLELVHPDDLENFILIEETTARTHEPYVCEYRARAADGTYVWFRDEALFVPEEGGYWQGVMMDITDQKRLEQELRDAAARFRTVVEQIPAIVYVDPLELEPVAATYLSPHIERMLGFPASIGATDPNWWLGMVHAGDRERVRRISDRADLDGTPYVDEYRLVAADGRTVWVHDEAVLVRDEGGRALFWQGVMYDVTDRKRAETDLTQALEMERQAVHRLREADEMKNTFLTAVSHDLRTPLAAILGNAVTLEHEEDLGISPEERRELAHRLAEKTRQLTAIVTDLLDLDRLVRGGADARRARVDVSQIVRRCAEEVDVGDRSLHVEAEPLHAAVDPPMLERIVENLLGNASRHTPAGTTIWVRVEPVVDGERPGALLVVEDDGPGVPAALRETLFLPFERGPSASPHDPGSGVGLSLVANFAALHGGRAWIEERPGGGASFRVSLPG
jgi:PAS domain S-box-containing protein